MATESRAKSLHKLTSESLFYIKTVKKDLQNIEKILLELEPEIDKEYNMNKIHNLGAESHRAFLNAETVMGYVKDNLYSIPQISLGDGPS